MASPRVEGVRQGQWPASLKPVLRGPASLCLRTGLIPRDGACLGVGGVLALEARARAGAAHDGRAEFTGTAVSWGIHLFQVPFHPVWVERRLARVEVSRLPARHVGGPRVEV